MPVSSLEPNTNNLESTRTYSVNCLKPNVKIDGSLFGFLLFEESLLKKNDDGHYAGAIKVDEKFVVFDDTRKHPYILSSNADVIIHCLFYKKIFKDDVDDDDDSSFNINISHTDESLYKLYHKN